MRTCPHCGARYDAPAQYCQRDGAALRVDAQSEDPYLGQKLLGQFRLERVIGSGGMGIVYGGWDEGLGRRVAVKILHRDLVANRDVVARFHREAQIAHQLDHPNIVRVILFGQLQDGNLYLVLEYLEGPTLLAALERDRVMAPARAVSILAQIAEGMGYAHRRDIVHRDLKPENVVLVTREGDPDHPKVLDFGIAKMLIGADTVVTQAGLIFGTAKYISPEGAQGEPVDKRSDVYSLGVIGYQMLCGQTPFEAQEPVQILFKHIHEPPTPLRTRPAGAQVPPALESVIMRALAKTPAARYGDGNAFARALREAMAQSDPNSAIRSMIATASMPLLSGSSNGGAPAPDLVRTAPAMIPAVAPQSMAAAAVAHPPIHQAPNPDSGVRPNPARAFDEPMHTMPIGSPSMMNELARESAASPTSPAAVASFGGFVPNELPQSPRHVPNGRNVEVFSQLKHTSVLPDRRDHFSPALGDADEFSVPGLPKSRSGAGSSRTMVTIVASVVLTVCLGVAAAWALGMFPSQRRDEEIRGLLRRAQDSLQADRLTHHVRGDDVEDVTDALLALDPGNAAARTLRRSAATRLRNSAVQEHNAEHLDRAIDLMRNAIRLGADGDATDVLQQFEREQRMRPAAPVVPGPPGAPGANPTTPPNAAGAARTATPAGGRPRPTGGPRTPGGASDPPEVINPPQPVIPTGPTWTPGRDPHVNPTLGHDPVQQLIPPVPTGGPFGNPVPPPVVVPQPPPDDPPNGVNNGNNGGGVAF